MLGKIKIDTNDSPLINGKWKISLDETDITKFVRKIQIVADASTGVPEITVVLVGQVEFPKDIQARINFQLSEEETENGC